MEKEQRVTSTAYSLAYACALPILQEVAREHGYALAVHGSMATDMDVIAVPWTEDAKDADTLAEAMRECVGGDFAAGVATAAEAAGIKPHGRKAYTILPSNLFLGVPKLPFSPWIDLSVMPKGEQVEIERLRKENKTYEVCCQRLVRDRDKARKYAEDAGNPVPLLKPC